MKYKQMMHRNQFYRHNITLYLLLEASHPDPTRALPLHPAGGLTYPRPPALPLHPLPLHSI